MYGTKLCAWTLVTLFSVGFLASAQDVIEKGDKAEYAFRAPLTNGMGVKSLSDLAGEPILVEFWGHR